VTRFASWSPVAARLLIGGLLLLIAIGLVGPQVPMAESFAAESGKGDAALYRTITDRVEHGENYYAAATMEQRSRGYPVRPFVTVRMPTLATTIATLGSAATALTVLRLIGGIALAAFFIRLRRDPGSSRSPIFDVIPVLLSAMILFQSGLEVWHESWAAAFILLSLGLRTPKYWVASVVAGFIACCFRELAMPFLLVMLLAAGWERRWPETIGWAVAVMLFGGVLGLHAAQVAAHVLPGDLTSPGWHGRAGWGFIIMMVQACTIFFVLPKWAVAIIFPLALLGLGGWRSALGTRMSIFVGGMIGVFMLIGRPDNFYWGLMFAPLLTAGVMFVPGALRDVSNAALGRRVAA
jgi:hypothetical protein